MDGDDSSHTASEIDYTDPLYFAKDGGFTETPFAPDGMSEIWGGSSVADSQPQPTESIFGPRGAAAEPAGAAANATQSGGANGAHAIEQDQGTEKSGDAPSANVTMTDEATEALIEDLAQTTEPAQDPQAEPSDDAPVEFSETIQNVQPVENNEPATDPARQQSAPVTEKARGRPRSRSQSSRASKALILPPQLPAAIHDSEVIGISTENDPPAENVTRPLNLGSSMLGRKQTGQSARERLLEKQAENRARYKAFPRQSIEQDAATAPAGCSDVEIIDSRQFYQYEAAVFGKTRQVLRYKKEKGQLSPQDEQVWREMEAKQKHRKGLISSRHECSSSQDPGALIDPRNDRVATAFKEVKALYNEKKQTGSLTTEEEIEFMKMEAQEKDRLRKKTIDAMSRRTPSISARRTPSVGPRRLPSVTPRQTQEAGSMCVGNDRLRRYKSTRPGFEMPREYRRASSEMPNSSGRLSLRHPSAREGQNANSRKRSLREASVDLDPDGRTGRFRWRTPQGKSTSNFFRFNKNDQQEFTDGEMNALLNVAKRQKDDAYNRRDRLHVDDGFGEQISFGDYFLEACKIEDRNGVPEAYLENCAEIVANTIRTEVSLPQYKGVPTKVRLEQYHTLWRRPIKKNSHTGRRSIDKDPVDHEFDKRKRFVYAKIRTSQITVEQAARFAIEWDIQRSRLQRRHLHDRGRSRTQAYPNPHANAAAEPHDGPPRFRLPVSAQFNKARKPDLTPLVEEASQILAEGLFHVGAASHRIQQCFSTMQPPASTRASTPAARDVASDTEGFQSEVQSENGDLFAN